MDIPFELAELGKQYPATPDALRALLAATPVERRVDMNTVLMTLLHQSAMLRSKREIAAGMVDVRTFVGGPSDKSHFLRQPPDVLIRALCRIAEIDQLTNATTEWLDEMEARNAAR